VLGGDAAGNMGVVASQERAELVYSEFDEHDDHFRGERAAVPTRRGDSASRFQAFKCSSEGFCLA
jgi:hypothetical protein